MNPVLRPAFWSLMFLNVALFAYAQGLFGSARTNEHEPTRLKRQFNTAKMTLLTRDQAHQRLGAVDQQTARLRGQLASARARGDADQARLSAAQAELDALQRQRGGVRGAATDEQVRALEARRRRLTDQLAGI